MNSKKAKAIRKELRKKGLRISAEPYIQLRNGMIVSKTRMAYQYTKKESSKCGS